MVSENNKQLSKEQIIEKLKKFCAYQERCRFDVIKKMHQLNTPKEDINQIVDILEKEDFLNESRFVEAFVRGKSATKKWGKNKIHHELRVRSISQELADEHLNSIPDTQNEKNLEQLALKKLESLKKLDKQKQYQRLMAFLLNKGYGYETIVKTLDRLFNI